MKIMAIAAVLLAKCVYDWFACKAMQDAWRMNGETTAIRDKIAKKRIAEFSERITSIERRMDKDYVTDPTGWPTPTRWMPNWRLCGTAWARSGSWRTTSRQGLSTETMWTTTRRS